MHIVSYSPVLAKILWQPTSREQTQNLVYLLTFEDNTRASWSVELPEMALGRHGRAAVVVMGDLGRSPRMQYHALSLANQAGLQVDVVAYAGTDPHVAVLQHPNIHLHLMQSPSLQGFSRIFYLLALPWKVVYQVINLIWLLLVRIPAPDLFLVQNPPSIPVLTVVKWACWFHKSAFVIDWHNFGYTLMGLTLGSSHPFVKIYHWYEKHYGKMADAHMCVTRAMQHELSQNWGIRASVVYDRAPDFFHPLTVEESHKLFCRLEEVITKPLGAVDCCSLGAPGDLHAKVGNVEFVSSSRSLSDREGTKETLFTCCKHVSGNGTQYFFRKQRPALIVSSTSWTPDEDFSLLLEAAVMYDRRVAASISNGAGPDEPCPFPCLLFVVTGKGPMKGFYEERISRLRLQRVAFRTMWLSAEDYPLLLGSADLGVSLHTSSSGLDLPMKVVDMFGCGLPVCAASYSCIGELVKDRKNGLLFSSSSELAQQFLELFKGFPDGCVLLRSLKDGALVHGSGHWVDEWEEKALPLIINVCS